MNEYIIDKAFLLTESDVEIKVILPLLTTPDPIGLGYSRTEIQSKISLKKLLIGKGDKSQLYYPDFILNINGVPVVVIEVKKLNEDLDEAFRQASLYAAEINRFFPSKINPCELIIASDGLNLYAGTWDNVKPQFMIPVENWLPTNIDFHSFITRFSQTSLFKISTNFRKTLRANVAFKNPLNLLGGKYIQNQTISNSFGESISIQYRHLFNPNEENERRDIVRNAYVRVSKHQSHIQPIDRLIRKKIRPAIEASKEIFDNTNPKEIIDKFHIAHNYNNQVLLLIGSVGSGKSTFSTYLRDVALDQGVMSNIFWTNLDLNDAPVTPLEIYKWIKINLIKQIKLSNEGVDFDNLTFIESLYEKELIALKKGPLSLLNQSSQKYVETIVDKMLEFQSDIDLTLSCYIRFFIHNKSKELIIILDNCDKRNLEEQLLMFEVANWIKDNIKAIVFLPLRDTTFDHFRNEKPLDTVIKDLIFRINPPSLEKVIYSRIKYANRLSEKSTANFYYLPNGFKVSYPSSDELYYLKSILSSLFQNQFFNRLISGLAGRDIRRGIEIFLDFCKSGHITDREIFKMKQAKGEFKIPNHIISRVFLRGSRVYYSDLDSRVKNIFHSEPSDDLPDPFIRIGILKWLYLLKNQKGPSGIVGFHRTSDLINILSRYGHSTIRILEELLFLIRDSLVISESQDMSNIIMEDLISINSPGMIHFELLRNIDYLSTCAEDVWYNYAPIAEEISHDMAGLGQFSHLSIQNSSKHSKILVEYLSAYYNSNFAFNASIIAETENIAPVDFTLLLEDIEHFNSTLIYNSHTEFEVGSEHLAKIVNIQSYGLICELNGSPIVGLIHVRDLNSDFDEIYKLGDEIKVSIKAFKPEYNKYNLLLVK